MNAVRGMDTPPFAFFRVGQKYCYIDIERIGETTRYRFAVKLPAPDPADTRYATMPWVSSATRK